MKPSTLRSWPEPFHDQSLPDPRSDAPPSGTGTTQHSRRVYDSIADLIPNPENPTPMVRLSRCINPNRDHEVLLKLEGHNPFGSIKDRTALFLLDGTPLEKGQVLVEPTSGNTGIALAALANARGLPLEIALPEGTPEEKKTLLRFLGVELVEVEDELCPLFPSEGARGVVKSMVESEAYEGRYVSPNQYENELNVEAHYRTTGPEIWRQTGGDIDAFYAGFGTCGTITGVARYLKERKPDIRIIGVEPAKREHHLSGMKKVTTLPEEFVPTILDRTLIDDIVAVGDRDAFTTGLRLAREDGIMVGPTTGALVFAALQNGANASGTSVVMAPDGAGKYMSFYRKFLDGEIG